jgi:iron complex transport system permease protein
LGAVIALQTGFAAASRSRCPVAALTGALIAVLLILALAGPRGGSLTLILAGIAISALAGALMSLALNLSPNPFAVSETVFWMLGSLADRSFWHVGWHCPSWHWAGCFWPDARGLDALTLGEDAAASLGIALAACA